MDSFKQQNLQRAAQVMFDIIPEWKTAETRKADQVKIKAAMKAEGYGDQVINGIADPRAMKLLRELVMLREQVATFETAGADALTKVRKAPKVIGAGGRVGKSKKKSIEKLKSAARNTTLKSGRRKAEMAAVKAILGAG